MHELAATKELVRMIEHECAAENIISPKKIIAELGTLKSYKKDPILFYYELLKKDSEMLKDSVLDIIEIEAELKCNECNRTSKVDQPYLLFCKHCNSANVTVNRGKDFILKEIIS